MGGAVAIEAATQLPFQAVFVLSTFTSVPDVYDVLKAKLPVLKWVMAQEKSIFQRFSSIDKIDRLQCPILMIQGDSDVIVPLSMSRRLFEKASSEKPNHHVIVPGGNHDNLFYIAAPQIMAELNLFLNRAESSVASIS